MDLADLAAFCNNLNGTTESVKWEHNLVFSVADRMYCIADLDGIFAYSVKVPQEDFEHWTDRTGIIPAPYLARAGWVKVLHPDGLSNHEWQALVQESYQLIVQRLTRKQKAAAGL